MIKTFFELFDSKVTINKDGINSEDAEYGEYSYITKIKVKDIEYTYKFRCSDNEIMFGFYDTTLGVINHKKNIGNNIFLKIIPICFEFMLYLKKHFKIKKFIYHPKDEMRLKLYLLFLEKKKENYKFKIQNKENEFTITFN